MNIPILPLLNIQSFVYQKCLIPREVFPTDVLPGTLAKCRVSTGSEYICNIYPMTNQKEANFCWLDDTVRVGPKKKSTSSILTSLEILNPNVIPATSVDLTFNITEQLFDIKKDPSKDYLAAIARQLLQPYTYVNDSFIDLKELRDLGISEINVKAKQPGVILITNETEIIVSCVQLQASRINQAARKLKAMETPRSELQQLIQSAAIYSNLNWKVKPSLNALVIGPSGSGKTSLCENFILENNCNFYVIRSTDVLRQYPGETEAELRRIFRCVTRFVQCFTPIVPMVILIEELDLMCPGSKGLSSDSGNSTRICGELIALLDNLHYSKESSKIIVLATTSNLEAISMALRSPGRFGMEVHIPVLTEDQRSKIFRSMVKEAFFKPSVDLTVDLLNMVAKRTQGFVAADFALLVQTIGHELLRKGTSAKQFIVTLERNLKVVKPSSFYGTDVKVYKTDEKFSSVGGMEQLKKTLDVAVLAGLRRKAAFERFGLCLPKGVLLYGPPGCAKTTIAKCLATEANMAFIHTSAAEVYSPYVGNSEKFISKIFDTARKNSPCVVFLDEIDSLVGKRTADAKSDVQTRILSTLLTEMDGIGVKLYSPSSDGNCILVIAATNRPDMIDDALMRPGRFDKLIYVPAPDFDSRLRILQIHAQKMPFAYDINLEAIAKTTESFSGADICNLCNEAAMYAFTQNIDAEQITMTDFKSVLKYQKSSLTKTQIQWYNEFEKKFKKH